MVDSVHAVTFLSSACVKASLWRWRLLFHLPVSVRATVGSWNGSRGNLYMCVGVCTKRWVNDFFILCTILTLDFGLHSYTHSTSITSPCPVTHRVYKESCPLQSGHCEAQACEICLWSCLGMRDYGGFRLQSPKLIVHTLTDGEIHGEQWTQSYWWEFHHLTDGRTKIDERFKIQDSFLCAPSKGCVVCWAWH